MGTLTLLCTSWLAASTVDSATVSTYTKIAVLPLESLGSTDKAVKSIERILVNEFGKQLGRRMVRPESLVRLRGGAGEALKECDGEPACLTEIFGALGWDAFVASGIAGLGEQRVINLQLYDVRTGAPIARTSVNITGEEKELIHSMRRATVELVAPEKFVGYINVKATQTDLMLMLNGQLVGTTPLADPKLKVPVGQHAFEARGGGLVPFETMVDVGYEEVVDLDVNLPENTVFVGGETPFRNRWWTWAMAAAGVVGVGIGGYFNYEHHQTVDRIKDRNKKGTLTADNLDLYGDEEAEWNRALIGYGVGGALLLGTGALWTFDFL